MESQRVGRDTATEQHMDMVRHTSLFCPLKILHFLQIEGLLQPQVIRWLLAFFFSFGCPESYLRHSGSLILVATCGIQFPDQGPNPGHLYWEQGVLVTGPQGMSQHVFFGNKMLFKIFIFIYLFDCARSQLWHVRSSSLTRDRTWGPCIVSAETQPLDHQ